MLNIKYLYKAKTNYLDKIFKSFNLTEKTIFIILSITLTVSSLTLFSYTNSLFLTKVPAHGGTLTEGVIGSPRFVNPLLELSDADRDLTSLVYSGLMRATPSGDLMPDLAESYKISDDGLTYTFKLNSDAYFHDGVKVTTDDIEYTITMAQNASLRSPKRTNWANVTIKKISPVELAFELKQPYSPFLENTTLGILPKHIWQSASTEDFPFSPYNNIQAIGSGPYQIEKVSKNGSGIPVSYELKAFNKYTLGKPFIDTLKFNFYPNEKSLAEAYLRGEIESTSALAPQYLDTLEKSADSKTEKIALPRIFGLFFNQNQAKIFLNKEVRIALNMTVDKDRIISEVLAGYGSKINGPLPNGIIPNSKTTEVSYNRDQALESARAILTKAGWKQNPDTGRLEKSLSKTETIPLAFSISTSNSPDLKKVAEIIKADWALLGAEVSIETFDPSDLNQTVISQRKYDALLFGEVIGRNLDLFAFWHSSQRLTGYNVALYTNSKVDRLLEDARQTTDKTKRLKDYELFQAEIENDIPAIFIYSPDFIYLLPKKVMGFESGLINNQSGRFEKVYQWYIETDQVWNFLIND